jgi:hypothetical protein
VECLQDNDLNIRRAGSDTFQRLSEQGTVCIYSAVASLKAIEAGLQQTILTFIPQIIELLTDNNSYARKFAADTVAKLSEQGR